MNRPFIRSRPKGLAFVVALQELYGLSFVEALPMMSGSVPLPSWEHVRALERMGARIPRRERNLKEVDNG